MADRAVLAPELEKRSGNDRGARPESRRAPPGRTVAQLAADPRRQDAATDRRLRDRVPLLTLKPDSATANGLPGQLKAGVEALSGLAMDDVQVHRNSPEPAKLGALAFTKGSDIHLGPGQEQHLPHEAWHVVQQKQGRVKATAQLEDVEVNNDEGLEAEAERMSTWPGTTAAALGAAANNGPTAFLPLRTPAKFGVATTASIIQRRRIPADEALEAIAAGPGAVNGLARVLARAGASWLSGNRSGSATLKVMGRTFKWRSEKDLFDRLSGATWQELIEFGRIIRKRHPGARLQVLFGEGVAPTDRQLKSQLKRRMTTAKQILDRILSGKMDRDLKQIFGLERDVSVAKQRYRQARDRLQEIEDSNNLYIDVSGFLYEVGMSGVTLEPNRILLSREIVQMNKNQAITTIIHEAMHAGSWPDKKHGYEIGDKAYLDLPSFATTKSKDKLINAAHYEVAPRRHLKHKPDFAGKTFSEGAPTVMEEVIDTAYQTFRTAWQGAYWVHRDLRTIYLTPSAWSSSHPKWLFYWSRVEGLTLHESPPAAASGAGGLPRPVTAIDVALSEGLIHKLRQCRPLAVTAAREKDVTMWAAIPGIGREIAVRRLVVSVLSKCGPLTGDIARDFQVVQELSEIGKQGRTYMEQERKPSLFGY